jgi:outer membrane protein, multidrug efflux system
MSRRVIALSLFLSASLGCAMGPRYQAPQISVPPSWKESSAPGTTTPTPFLDTWWTAFHDELLDSLITRAAQGNLDLKIAAARVREARAARGIAAAGGLPQVAASANYARTQRSDAVPPFKGATAGPSPFGSREQNAFEAGFDAQWEIDVFGGVKHDREAALAQFQATEEARRDVLVTLLGDVARNYAELRGAQRRLQIIDEIIRSQQDTLGLAKARFDAGLATDLDVSRAEGLLATTTAQRPLLEQLAKQAVHRLGVLVGKDPGALAAELEPQAPIPPVPPELPLVLPSELLSRRPDLRRAERELAAATARVGVARADLFPRFSILGAFGRRSEDVSDLSSNLSHFFTVIPGVRWPILSGGRIRANIRVQNARQEQALDDYEKAVLTALEEVENALLAYSREGARRDALRDAVTAEHRALDLATERYTGGLENFLSVLDAQRTLFAAEDQLVQSETSTVVAIITLYKTLGGGWSLDTSQQAPSQPVPDRVSTTKPQGVARVKNARQTAGRGATQPSSG